MDILEIALGSGRADELFSKLAEKLSQSLSADDHADDCDCPLHRLARKHEAEPQPASGARAVVELQELCGTAVNEVKQRARKGGELTDGLYLHPCNPLIETALITHEVERMNAAQRLARTLYELLPEDERPPLSGTIDERFAMMTVEGALSILETSRAKRRARIAARDAAAEAKGRDNPPEDDDDEDEPAEEKAAQPQAAAAP